MIFTAVRDRTHEFKYAEILFEETNIVAPVLFVPNTGIQDPMAVLEAMISCFGLDKPNTVFALRGGSMETQLSGRSTNGAFNEGTSYLNWLF